jgi:phage recombination protein Bet
MHNKLIQKFAERFSFDEDQIVDTLKATAFKVKEGVVTDAQMMALLIVADQYGLNPFTREIYAFPDKQNGIVPVVGIDGWARILNSHSAFDGMAFQTAETMVTPEGGKPCPEWLECILFRKDRSHPVSIREYLDEVYREPFKGQRDGKGYTVAGPWQTHTKRMLRHKATIQAARMAFGFVGIYDQDEAERILEGQAEVLTTGPVGIPFTAGEASEEAQRMAAKLIARAEKAGGAWQAALEYAAEHFVGADLDFVNAEIRKAQKVLSAPKSSEETGSKVPGREALAEARRTLQETKVTAAA